MIDLIIKDYQYTVDEIVDLLDVSTNTSTKISIPKLPALMIMSSATLLGANVEQVKENKPKIEVVVNSSFKLDEYQKFISTTDNYENIFCVNANKRECIETILSFKSLVHNWDGFGAYPLQIKSASNAIDLITELENINDKFIKPEDIYPNPNGTVSLTWENDFGEKLSTEIGNSNFSYFVKYNNLEPEFYSNVELNRNNIEMLSSKIKSLF